MAKGKLTEGEWLERPAKTAKAVQKAKKKAGPKGLDYNRDYAFTLYMQKKPQGEIAARCNVSQQTITNWKQVDNWEAKRAAKSISVGELIAKTLQKANEMLDADDFNADAFAKAVAQLKTLKTGNTVDDAIMCFMTFQNYLMEQAVAFEIDEAFIKKLVSLQDHFIKYRMGNG